METYLIRFTVRPEQRDRFLRLLTGVLDHMRHEETFIDARLAQVADSPNEFVLHETWASREDVLNVQLNRPYRKEWHEALPELLAAERDITILSPLWPETV
ncbi:Quinol monooxygenase YgiN [Paracoccus alcaliphilus]|uniref:Quinol monooxygenase YgiN n=1 Tax=Paracoccus alcaliphilus TaxID=34002 RepID=A0A1H8G173_9RHOB|nr:putative quinol monooxygenase [Paracoccus alcaliphilus]WCR20305.1 antibiotic biosynthesis monooxygenase [Paracoccus alcaliphilus]SEN37702.1 Quinol monooxygenase YgiN [Paracoccus alcaliphilus]